MHHKIWLSLISILLLGSAGGCVTANQPVQAAKYHHVRIRRRRPRYRRVRSTYRAPKRRRYTISRIPSGVYPKDLLYYTQNGKIGYTPYYLSHPHYETKMSKGYINSVVQNEYKAINGARRQIREKPLVKNATLTRLASLRAQQAFHHFTHYNKQGQPLAWLDAEEMHLGSYRYNRQNIGENMFYVGKLSEVPTNSGVAGYYFKDPWAMAGDNVFDSLNNDAASQWTHGENIMMPQHRYIGISTYYKGSNQSLYVLVEFSSKRPVVHRK